MLAQHKAFLIHSALIQDDTEKLLVGIAYTCQVISNFVSPSSLLEVSPSSLIVSAAITAGPVVVQLWSGTLHFHMPSILLTIVLGATAVYLSRPSRLTVPQISQISFPVGIVLSVVATSFADTVNVFTVLPSVLMYYGIFSLTQPLISISVWNRLRSHPLFRKVLHKDDSRKIFIFLCLNLGFMFIQMGYGIYTNSLGLVSDSIHMLVDCAAIAFGLAASILADDSRDDVIDKGVREHANHHDHNHHHEHEHHSHDHCDDHFHSKAAGKWFKLEDLAGFANGVFLVFVCLSILAEALGRLVWPEEVVEVEQLLVVSILGLIVNLIGVFSFNHGYRCFGMWN